MIVFSDVHELRSQAVWAGCIATIGNFDGVHKGHQELLHRTVIRARERNLPAVVITFDPHPAAILSHHPPKNLCSTEQRLDYIGEQGIDAVLLIPFNQDFAALSAEFFCHHVLIQGLQAQELFIGYDFRMGSDQVDAAQLKMCGFQSVTAVDAVLLNGKPVSSTRVRAALQSGHLLEANNLLGRPFSVRGEVVHGEGRGGPLLGIPTANLNMSNIQAMPVPAVYATSARRVSRDGVGPWLKSVTSFCKNPTFSGTDLTLETHILDFTEDIYGEEWEVCFLEEIRKDRRFDSLDALIAQLHEDMRSRRSLFA
jgi:riboflavin kinase/FMN adenylyltransferase